MNSFATTRLRSTELTQSIADAPQNYRVLTGERPTGPLHLGHFFGSIVERLRL
ncbi:hypothetical protein M2368_000545 [Arthrobacter sp. JUb119]|nr:hypothetical protein [Arthrobacter sp. JUb119]